MRTRSWLVLSSGVCVLPLVAALAGCTSLVYPYRLASPLASAVFAYVEAADGNLISSFAISPTGMLNPTAPPSVATGRAPLDLVAQPTGQHVYAINGLDNTVSMFQVDAESGALSPTAPATIPTGLAPQSITIDPAGRFVYTANLDDDTISMFLVDHATGLLNPNAPSKVAAGPLVPGHKIGPLGISVDPLDRFVFVTTSTGSVLTFLIKRDGTLTSGPVPSIAAGTRNFPAVADPGGRFLYVPDEEEGLLLLFAINPNTGALSALTPAYVPVGANPSSVAVDPSGRYLYVVNRGDQSLSEFALSSSTGVPRPLTSATIAVPGEPWQIVADPSGHLAYVSNEGTGTVDVFSIGTDGTLTLSSTAQTGAAAAGIAIIK